MMEAMIIYHNYRLLWEIIMKKTVFMRFLAILIITTLCIGGCSQKTGEGEGSKDMTLSQTEDAADKGDSGNNPDKDNTDKGDAGNITDKDNADKGSNIADIASDAGITQNSTTENAAADAGEVLDIPDMTPFETEPGNKDYIELALNVYYNDAESSYYSNESGSQHIFVTDAGQYALTFDCKKDLSDEAVKAGVKALRNLTAVYITDMQVLAGTGRSPLKSCNIMYDRVIVDGTELTVTLDKPKAAFKTNGIFDTNDPVNSWDGSWVEEVEAAEHVANFTTVTDPERITVVFTLSDLVWSEDQVVPDTENSNIFGSGETAGEANGAVFSTMDLASMDARSLSYYMGNGINLGNTFEAVSTGKNASVSVYESAWGQPKTTRAMIEGYKRAGFDSLRIPVAWTNTMDFMNGDFEINADYLERVAEIVGYALENEMFVIINDHWDSGWWAMFGSSDPDTTVLARKIYEQMWTQVATYFRDYSHMLIFESANEELGNGLNNNGAWPDSGKLTTAEKYNLTNQINQRFVDIVRGTGGNNAERFLLIAGYNTDISDTCNSLFKMPEDKANGKLFLSVHYYTPWNYCGVGPDGIRSKWGIKADYDTMDKYLGMLKKYSDLGYGIIIGEYGALPVYDSATGKHETQENTAEFTEYFLDHCDINNWVPMLWDTNGTYDKSGCALRDTQIAAIYSSRRFEKENEAGAAYLENVKKHMETVSANAPAMWSGVETYKEETPVAWIMWNGGAGTYSVGDVFNPADNTDGIIAHNVVVEGGGTYTVSLEFENGNDGVTFAALAVANAETLYPNCYIVINSITADGTPLDITAVPYTCSDDGRCTRVNLINEWVKTVPQGARTLMGPITAASAVILDKTQLVGIHDITVNFGFVVR